MKKTALIIIAALALAACDSQVSDVEVGDSDGERVSYMRDARTGLCFALVGSRATLKASATGLGMASVPCDRVAHMLASR